jgi:hypothetical protein
VKYKFAVNHFTANKFLKITLAHDACCAQLSLVSR